MSQQILYLISSTKLFIISVKLLIVEFQCVNQYFFKLIIENQRTFFEKSGLYSRHVPIVPVLVESWSGLVNFGSWWPNWASYKNINEKTFKM